MKFLDLSRLFLYDMNCKIVVFCLYLERKAAYPEGLKIGKDFSIAFKDNIFTVSFQIINREDTAMASADFQGKRINLEVK